MIFAGFPIALRELHHLVRGWLRFARLRPDHRAGRARYHFVYFSYAPDFEYLALSLRTLRLAVEPAQVGAVYVAEDQKAPFDAAQQAALRSIWPQIRMLPVHDFEWGSPRSTHAELQLFLKICSSLPDPRDLLVKVDSDVLLLPNPKWARILHSEAPAIGDGHFVRHRYAQGGLYMIRREIAQRHFPSVTVSQLEQVARRVRSVGEDTAISCLLRDAGQPFLLTRMMLFPDEYRPLRRIAGPTRQEFLALHCHKDKRSMVSLAQRLGLLPTEVRRET